MFFLGMLLGGCLGAGLTIAVSMAVTSKNRDSKVPITEGQWWDVKGIGAVQVTGYKTKKDYYGRVISTDWHYSADVDEHTYAITPEDLWKTGTIIHNIKAWRMARDIALSNAVAEERALAEVEALASRSISKGIKA
jgi:hypothetical protein